MKLQEHCLTCIYDQTKRVCELLNVDEQQAQKIDCLAHAKITMFDMNQTPPHNAAPLYEAMAEVLGVHDLYAQFKADSSEKAKAFLPLCEQKIKASSHKLFEATKTAVAGNVIDLAAVMLYDLEEELEKIYHTPFAIDDFVLLEQQLAHTQTLVYLADNAGEEIFDKLYIQTIKELFPQINVYYFVRGRPIINDLTCQDALASGMNDVATIVDSGVPTPGLALELMNENARVLFEKAECIISKGMGNYECLGEVAGLPIFFLFKVKCNVVAQAVGAQLGNIICKRGI
ncbi:ARMT1-like domain-containing protein [Sulfurospirillum sp. 'SP']|nr:ARMT1-like domain-containing protein [Sulfurospirillum sp. 'SP']WNY99361.1 ARMT1-like domain-containing protein [Sulfurospirillum sp. 'SP']